MSINKSKKARSQPHYHIYFRKENKQEKVKIIFKSYTTMSRKQSDMFGIIITLP